MEELKLVIAPAEVLTQKAQEVKPGDPEIPALAKAMIDICTKHKGLGLAANQVGVLKRVIVVNVFGKKHEWKKQPYSATKGPVVMVNPTFMPTTSFLVPGIEGCLSHPGKKVRVHRSDQGTCHYTTLEGVSQSITITGMYARCVQHEIDHLNGVNIVDKI